MDEAKLGVAHFEGEKGPFLLLHRDLASKLLRGWDFIPFLEISRVNADAAQDFHIVYMRRFANF